MCGIAGLAGFDSPELLVRMCRALAHRGPDSEGFARLPEARIQLGMRRLAIIDLAGGAQPMWSDDRRVCLVHNGEIYNHAELRVELEQLGHRFRTASDTEVVLAAYLAWGEHAWSRLQGMFALAIADLRGELPELRLVRDRVGIKPLYYAECGGRLVFASELKALLSWDDLPRDVDPAGLRAYLALRYVPGPDSLLRGVSKLPPGAQLCFRGGCSRLQHWWRPPPPAAADASLSPAAGAALLGDALRASVRRHLVSDVPVGAFLSGGVDSSVLVALMCQLAPAGVRTFSIGFPDFAGDELDAAARTAALLGTQHTAIECRASDLGLLPEIAWSLDEPIGDAIVVPMYVLAREARRQVKVVLSGEGADEILGGYLFQRRVAQLARARRWLPGPLWPGLARALESAPLPLLDALFDYPSRLGSDGRRRLAALVASVARGPLPAVLHQSIALFDARDLGAALVPGALPDPPARVHPPGWSDPAGSAAGSALQQLIGALYRDWLPDDILMKLDKMTMAHSLEGRVPFLDEAVLLAAARLPDPCKTGRGACKRALREFARTLLPAEIAAAPKQPFYFPLESYLHSAAMQDVLKRTLEPERIRRRGLIRPEWLRAQREAPASAGFLPLKRVFSVAMLELWFERFCPDAAWAAARSHS